jgi:PAS domain S-box-containing protein
LKQIQKRKESINGNYDVKYITKSGKPVWTNISTNPIFDEDGTYKGSLAMVTDISERKQAEDKIQENETQKEFERRDKEALINTTEDLMWSVSSDFKLIAANQAFTGRLKKSTGINFRPGDGLLIKEKLPSGFIDFWEELYKRALNGESFVKEIYTPAEVYKSEVENHPELWGEIRFNPIYNGNLVTGIACYSRDITAAKNYQNTLLEINKKLETAQQIAKLGYWEQDIDTKTLYWSNEMYNIWDVTPGTFVVNFRNFYTSIHPDDREKFNAAQKQVRESKEGLDVEYRIVLPGNSIKYVHQKGEFVFKEKGDPVGIEGTVQDITERKKAEETLSNNELRFRTLTVNAPVGIFQTDANGKTIYVNDTWLQYTGMEIEEVLGDGWMKAVHPDDRESLVDDWHNKFQKGLKSSSEYRLVEKNGNTRWVSGRAVPLFNNAGEITGHIGTLSDITDRKNAEVEIRRSEERYRQIVETAQEGIWLIDENNVTTFVNKKMAEILEYSIEEMMGKKNYCFMDEEWQKIASQHIERRKQGIEESNDFKFISKSGKNVWTNLSTNPVFDEKGRYKGALAMITDITQRKLHEDLLRQSETDLEIKNKQLEQKNKELEQFAYIASHDMQEPLRTTSSFVELLQQQYQGRLDEKADKYLTFIAQSSDRMKVLIKDLLDYSRIGRKKELAEVDCNIMLDEVLADLGTAINETGAEIKTGQLPVISGYQTEIKQLFQNLIMNAIKFRKKNISPQIKISAENIPGFWLFAFKDNGIGIEEKHNERIFEIFQRLHTRTEYEGSGIGLAHSKKIVELHSGRIWVESEFGQGATFYFTIRKNKNDEKEIKLHITH